MWSPDGKWIAFTTLSDNQRGYIWKIAVDGAGAGSGAPQQLTKALGEYLNTAWSPDGKTIVVTRGSGASVHGRTVAANQFYQFVKVPAEGGDVKAIITVNRPVHGRPSRDAAASDSAGALRSRRTPVLSGDVRPGAARETEDRTEIVSVDLEGRDRQVHVMLNDADEAAVSPDGQQLAFQEGDNVYLMAFPTLGTGEKPRAHRQAQGPPAGDARSRKRAAISRAGATARPSSS